MRTINYSGDTAAKLTAFDAAVKAANQAKLDGKPYAEKDGLLDQAKAAARELNKAISRDALTAYSEQADKEMAAFFTEYMKDFFVRGYDVRDTEDKGVIDVEKPIRVWYGDIIYKAQPAMIDNWRDLMQIFVDHCLMQFSADGGASKNPLPAKLVAKRSTMGSPWVDAKGNPVFSKGALKEQMDAIVVAVCPAGTAVPMRKYDVRNFGAALLRYVNMTENSAMKFHASTNRKAIERLFFDTLYTRMNNLNAQIEDDYSRERSKNPELDETMAKAASALKTISEKGIDLDTLIKAAKEAKKAGAILGKVEKAEKIEETKPETTEETAA